MKLSLLQSVVHWEQCISVLMNGDSVTFGPVDESSLGFGDCKGLIERWGG